MYGMSLVVYSQSLLLQGKSDEGRPQPAGGDATHGTEAPPRAEPESIVDRCVTVPRRLEQM